MSNPKEANTGPKKRKRSTDKLGTREKVTKQKRAKKIASNDDDEELTNGLNHVFTRMDSQLLSDYVFQRVRRFGGDLSSVEMEDQYIPKKAFKDTSSWDKSRCLSNLPDFLEYFSTTKNNLANLSSAPDMNGSPHTIVITGSGIRAADITRALRKFQTEQATVAKLFAKHIKLKEAIAFVKKTRMGVAIGTPTRLIDLLNEGALSVEKLQRLIIDCSYIDQKKRGILDMRETQAPLMELLNRQGLKGRYGAPENGVDLLFY
ncbi:MAG: hypothetical protein M1813_006356 [Trichoglossum hirsutum]|nr:MAG: hypothetical protein M1813_006356 [Trichoglossum hirsutum]